MLPPRVILVNNYTLQIAFACRPCCTMPKQPQPGQSSSVSITVADPNLGKVERTFILHLPSGYSTSNDVPTPLVLDLHGWGGSGAGQEYEGGFDDVADEEGFIVVHADGFGDPAASSGSWGSWNCSRDAIQCCCEIHAYGVKFHNSRPCDIYYHSFRLEVGLSVEISRHGHD